METEGHRALKAEAERLFTEYSSGRLTRECLCGWIVSLSVPPHGDEVVDGAKTWFARDASRRNADELMIQDLGWLLRLSAR